LKLWKALTISCCLVVFCAGIAAQSKEGKKMESHTTKLDKAMFAAGCFWKVQYIFSKVPGVVDTAVGYAGGKTADPTYKDVCTDSTGHAEVVQVKYDPAKVSYKKLLETFWTMHDPTTLNRQGPDVGTQYRSAVFFENEQQKVEALQVKAELAKSGKFKGAIVTEISPAQQFHKAEDYHQNYFEKHGQVCH